MKTKLLLLLVFALILAPLASCGGTGADINIAILRGPTGMGMAKLMSDAPAGYSFKLESAPDAVVSSLLNGEADIAALPVNLAATLYNKNEGDIITIAVNTLGVLYILEEGSTINSVADLRGKTVYATAQGSTTEYILNHILTKNGLIPGSDVTVEFMSEHSELAASLAAGSVKLGMLPEPNVTAVLANSDKLRVALDLNAEWDKISSDGLGESIVQGCIVVRKEFLDSNKKAVDDFLKEYKKSVDYVNDNPAESAKLIVEQSILANEDQAREAIPRCNIVYIDGANMKSALEGFLAILFEANPASVGGVMPDDGMYYIK